MPDEIALFPVAGWQSGPVPAHGLIALKFQYLSTPMQRIEEAQTTQMFAMTADQTRQLIEDLQRQLDRLESDGSLGAGVDHH